VAGVSVGIPALPQPAHSAEVDFSLPIRKNRFVLLGTLGEQIEFVVSMSRFSLVLVGLRLIPL
jgi:hypothetical protein